MSEENKIKFHPVDSKTGTNWEMLQEDHSFGTEYNVEVEAEAPVAKETAPTMDEVSTPPSLIPEDIEDPWEKVLKTASLVAAGHTDENVYNETFVEEVEPVKVAEVEAVAVEEATETITPEPVSDNVTVDTAEEWMKEKIRESTSSDENIERDLFNKWASDAGTSPTPEPKVEQAPIEVKEVPKAKLEVVEPIVPEVVKKATFDLSDGISADPADEEILEVIKENGSPIVVPSFEFETQLKVLNEQYGELVPEEIAEDVEILIEAAIENPSAPRIPLVQRAIDLRNRIEILIDLYDKTGLGNKFYKNLDGVYHMGFKDPSTGEVKGFRPLSLGASKGAVSSEEALLKAATFFNTGVPIDVPLPHSGFWIYITPLSESDMVILYNTFADVKSRIGKLTFGLVYSNQSVKAVEVLFDFCKRFIFSSSIDGVSKEDYLSLIKENDIFTIAWALIRSSYATGFPFTRMCSNDKCNHEETVNFDLTHMFHFDNSRLTDFQKQHFSLNKPRAMKLDDVLRYQAETDFNAPYVFEFNGAKIHLKQPTVEEFISDGNAWIDDIDRKVDEELAKAMIDPDEAEFKEELLIDQFLRTSFVRNWYHYVDKIEFGENIAESRNAIYTVIGIMGTRRKFYDGFAKAVADYRNRSVISTVGIREYLCPSCGVNQGDETGFIPLDVLNLFFTMSHIKYLVVTGDQMR